MNFQYPRFISIKQFTRIGRKISILLLVFSLLLSPVRALTQQHDTAPQEYGLKAVYLYNFLQFTYWPEEKCTSQGQKVTEIAVIGDSAINSNLLALQDELRRTQKVEIVINSLGPYRKDMDLTGCRLLYIAPSEKGNIGKILSAIEGQPTLTISDIEECLDLGCMIALISRMNKVRWAINRHSLQQSGLRLNANLLRMAVKIVD